METYPDELNPITVMTRVHFADFAVLVRLDEFESNLRSAGKWGIEYRTREVRW